MKQVSLEIQNIRITLQADEADIPGLEKVVKELNDSIFRINGNQHLALTPSKANMTLLFSVLQLLYDKDRNAAKADLPKEVSSKIQELVGLCDEALG